MLTGAKGIFSIGKVVKSMFRHRRIQSLIAFVRRWFEENLVKSALSRGVRVVFNRSSMPYSLYLPLGVFLSQFSNIRVYEAKGAQTLQTWFLLARMTDYAPYTYAIKLVCVILAFAVFLILQFLIRRIRLLRGEQILNRGVLFSVILCSVSQLLFSSIMRLSYEFSFCLIVFGALTVSQVFLDPPSGQHAQNLRKYQELWDLLKILIPISIGFPILMGGGGFIASFYGGEQEFVRVQLYRHIGMALYFQSGAFMFLLLPIMRRTISLRRSL